jgi:uncharacterized protein (DUF433 family)
MSDLVQDDALLSRVTANPKIFGGKPIIRGMREPEDIRACLAYAHAVIAEDKLDAVRID